MFRFDGKVVVITGGARGQGAATAELFAERGATIVLADVLAAEAEARAASIGRQASFLPLDVSSPESWKTMISAIIADHGKIDILVNNAAISRGGLISEMPPAMLDELVGVNLKGVFLGMQSVIPHMKRAGSGVITNIASVNGFRGTAGMGAYDATKWAVRGITKSAALECASANIRVNSVHPGTIDTPMLNPEGCNVSSLAESFSVPLGRVGLPMEVAYATLFLSSSEASYITGAELSVDGGWSAGVRLDGLPRE